MIGVFVRLPRPHWGPATAARLALVVLAVLAVGACSTSGRELATPDAPVPPRVDEPLESVATAVTGAGGFEASADVLVPGAQVPESYTARGAGVVPPIEWRNLPAGTAEIAVVIRNIDDNDALHWVAAGIPPDLVGLIGSNVPPGTIEYPNATGTPGYLPMNAPAGVTQRFVITVYALPEPLNVPPGTDGSVVVSAIETTALDSASVMVRDTGPTE